MASLRASQLDVWHQGQWHSVAAILDETALTLSPIDTDEPTADKRVIRVVKRDGFGLGISIQGGADNSRPIIISKIFPGMAADQTNQLFVGDVIIAVNGESLIGAKHDEAVRILKKAGHIVDLHVQYRQELLGPKESVISKLTWDDDDAYIPDKRLRSFSLKLAFVTRSSLDREDVENRTFEIRSHSAHHILTFRCQNADDADLWFESVHSCTDALLTQALAQVNLILGQEPQVRQMGWMAEQGVRNGCLAWKPVFAALTTNDLLLYESVPALKQEWAMPWVTRPLIATRVVQTTARTFPVIAGLSDVISFTLRTGTQEGIRSHLFRVETHRELSIWVKSIIHCTYDACVETREVTTPCVWQDQDCELSIHLDEGITMISRQTGELLWRYSFESLRATWDDTQKFLWMDVGPPGGEMEIDLLGSPKPVVFILHSFLATKVYQAGLYA